MLEKLIYKNHLSEVFDFGRDGVYINASDLHDYDWTVNTKNGRISAFNKALTTRKLPCIIYCDSEAEGIAKRNRLMEIVEKDILSLQHGEIILGDYYFKCYVTSSTKKDYLITKRLMYVDLVITTDFPFWVKETTLSFRASDVTSSEGLDYPTDYPFDYANSSGNAELVNPSFAESNFRMIIYGSVTNPSVYVNDHCYSVECEVDEGEYLTIDSVNKKVFITGTSGEIRNVFSGRNRESYIFEKIPSGISALTIGNVPGIDIVILEERSEPKWI